MDTIESIGRAVESFFATFWDGFLELYADEPWLVIAVAAGVIVLLAGLWVWMRRRRTARRAGAAAVPASATTPARTTIRRPVYLDALLLDDLLAHVETRDYSRDLRDTLEGGRLEDDGHAGETRKLNKVLAGMHGRTDLVTNLDEDDGADLTEGRAVIVTGRLVELPATAAAELLELSTPLLTHAPSDNGDDGALKTRPRQTSTATPTSTAAPLVLRLEPTDGDRNFLVVLPREGLRVDDPDSLGGRVTLIGVVDEVLGSRDRLGPDRYLKPGLSSDVREHIRDRELSEVVSSLADAAGTKLSERDLTFKGPGARVTPAAIYR
ncbi:MAG: hypothetical protein KY469_18710 [Actinobacteria bacterium]|nr:hypothetical protein [Actinomycetota bacterium]